MEQPKDKEEALAGLLNGTVITLLGGAMPALFILVVTQNWRDLLGGDFLALSSDTMLAVGVLMFSPRTIRFGLRMLHLNWTSLRKL
ncbi:MAG: hypothetical protein Q8R97_10290 [Brevundimonas sp.]|uniref:hypothetical protein n=1 Tax=Brevundimonas sp. TaxID=1871086 RepID=UPI00274BF1F9|nr:hypothetical protein [Brevundimonas sp.]MDP3401499.1 hypothetical protein [Brevundimonas sp.]MDZ4110354.1 hypothetical protein [Brevundimonas sp.]